MAVRTGCMTPGATYTTHVGRSAVSVGAVLPFGLDLTEAEAERLQAAMHDALERVLAPVFARRERTGLPSPRP